LTLDDEKDESDEGDDEEDVKESSTESNPSLIEFAFEEMTKKEKTKQPGKQILQKYVTIKVTR
jgi:hypothetical protein